MHHSNYENITLAGDRLKLPSAILLAIALTASPPIFAGSSGDKEEKIDLETPQYSATDDTISPKRGNASEGDGHGVVESDSKQYSAQDGTVSPKSRNAETQASSSGDPQNAEASKQYSAADGSKSPKSGDRSQAQNRSQQGDQDARYARDWSEGESADAQAQPQRVAQSAQNPFANGKAEGRELSKWIGNAVYSSDRERIGEVSDVVVDLEQGNASHILIDNAGLFTGSRLVEVKELKRNQQDNRMELSLSAAQFNERPRYNREDTLDRNIYVGWTTLAAPTVASEPFHDQERQSDQRQSTGTSNVRSENSSLAFASDLKGMDVETAQGEEIGEVERLIMSQGSGAIYAVLEDIEEEIGLESESDGVAIELSRLAAHDDELRTDLATSEIRDAPKIGSQEDGSIGQPLEGSAIIILFDDPGYALSR